jgi:hypothetical protein
MMSGVEDTLEVGGIVAEAEVAVDVAVDVAVATRIESEVGVRFGVRFGVGFEVDVEVESAATFVVADVEACTCLSEPD